jgi:hypothetical protein
MKKYIDEDIIDKTITLSRKYSLTNIFDYIELTGYYDFILPAKYYIKIVSTSYSDNSNVMKYSVFGRTKDDMPYFSIAGITFTMITEEEADKFRILK